MINIKEAIREDIIHGVKAAMKAEALPKVKELPAIAVRGTDNAEHGDYASPVGLMLSKLMKKAPLDIIATIVEHMPKKEYVGKLEAAAPGFLNIRINPGWMQARLDDVIKEKDLCSEMNLGKGQHLDFEFISANPTGPLTLGNVRTAFSVDTLANVLTCAGYNVTREYYINDAGGQIMKLGESVLRRALQSHHHKVEYDEKLYQGDYVKEIAKNIADAWQETEGRKFTIEDLENRDLIQRLGEQAADILLGAIKQMITDDLRIKFDVWTSERQLRESGIIEKVVDKLRAHHMTYKKDGAEYLKTTKYGDSEDRVLIKKDGEYAYIALGV